jgi:uncharacterized membrane protein HdeD (DUF308 family)
MLEALARNWCGLLFRAVLSVSYGIAVLAWPALSTARFVYWFGVYAIFDGVVALAIAMNANGHRGFGNLLFESIVRLGGGLVALGVPEIMFAFPRMFAVWALLTGIAEIAAAAVLRRELSREWPLPVAGGISIAVALILLIPYVTVHVVALRWLVGPYAMCFGVMLLAFARRMRQLAHEIEVA